MEDSLIYRQTDKRDFYPTLDHKLGYKPNLLPSYYSGWMKGHSKIFMAELARNDGKLEGRGGREGRAPPHRHAAVQNFKNCSWRNIIH
jgi:hypothetical protein